MVVFNGETSKANSGSENLDKNQTAFQEGIRDDIGRQTDRGWSR